MKSKKIITGFVIIIALLVTIASALAYETVIDDPVLGTAKITIEDRGFFANLFSSTQQTIFAVQAKVQLGEKVKIRAGVEITECIKKEEISSVRMVFTAPSGKTTTQYLQGNFLSCASNPEIIVEFTPQEKGKWTAFYLVRKTTYPYVAGKEITEFEVVDGTPQCSGQKIGDWKPSSSILNGQLYTRQTFSYDANCKSTLLSTEIKTVCRENYVIQGTLDNVGTGMKTCVKKPAEESPIIVPPPAKEVSTWMVEGGACVLKPTVQGFVSKEECELTLVPTKLDPIVHIVTSICTHDIPVSACSYDCEEVLSSRAGSSLSYRTEQECRDAIALFSKDEVPPPLFKEKTFLQKYQLLIALLVLGSIIYLFVRRARRAGKN